MYLSSLRWRIAAGVQGTGYQDVTAGALYAVEGTNELAAIPSHQA